MKGQGKLDEFAIVLLAGVILIIILMVVWTTPTEFPPTVEPRAVSLDMQNGTSMAFTLNITGLLTNANLTASGPIAKWLKFDSNFFDVIESKIVQVTVSVPDNARQGSNKGAITVASTGGSQKIDVEINVKVAEKVSSKTFDLGSFEVSFRKGTKVVGSKEDSIVSQGYFSGKSPEEVFNVDDKDLQLVNGGSISILIDDTNGLGSLIVLFNEQEVYNKISGAGEIKISLDSSKIKKPNTITIKASTPGIMFWAETVYVLKNMKFSISTEGSLAEEKAFVLQPKESQNFEHVQLTYNVKDYLVPVPKLKIKLNDQTVFDSVPTTGVFNRNFDKDVSGNRLKLETQNTVSFSFEKEGFYSIGDAVLTVFYRT